MIWRTYSITAPPFLLPGRGACFKVSPEGSNTYQYVYCLWKSPDVSQEHVSQEHHNSVSKQSIVLSRN